MIEPDGVIEMEFGLPGDAEVFTHHDGATGVVMTFLSGFMFRFAEANHEHTECIKLLTLNIDPGHVENTLRNKGIEQERLDRLIEPYLSRPCVGCMWDNKGGVNIIDGHHRIVKLHQAAVKTFRAYVFHPLMWKQFLIELPDAKERLTLPSRVIEYEQSFNQKSA